MINIYIINKHFWILYRYFYLERITQIMDVDLLVIFLELFEALKCHLLSTNR